MVVSHVGVIRTIDICSTRCAPHHSRLALEGERGEGGGDERCLSKERQRIIEREMGRSERAWMQYARYNMMGTFFFC